ncbi:MAG TPA: transcriptional repressor [Candidatus Binatia bacterium]|nr:transcriptional repressor [Candidatus Binatia bacterium]
MSKRTLPPAVLEQLRGRIRGAGLRSTAPRVTVLRELEAASTPVTHADLVADLVPQGFDRATIYRNLIDLTDAGLVSRTDLGDHVWRFELRRPERKTKDGEHPHFMCTDCGTVACLPGVSVRIKSPGTLPRSLRARAVDIQLKGRCDRCA